jgi:hypothetical protein
LRAVAVTNTQATAPPAEPEGDPTRSRAHGWIVAAWIAVGVAVAIGVALRFWTQSNLWLDEALSVNIAKLPVGDIPAALRHDGHPPLYYWLLHGWMSVFGESDRSVRALSGVFAVLALPLMWLAGRRVGGRTVAWLALVLLALNPWAFRYATEARMYSMVVVLPAGPPAVITLATMNPPWNPPIMLITSMKKVVGLIIGQVTAQNLLQLLAPSISAASYISLGTF